MNSFFKRVLSAVVAAMAVAGLVFFLGAAGLQILTVFAVVVGGLEFAGMIFRENASPLKKNLFYVSLLLVFLSTSFGSSFGNLSFAAPLLLFLLVTLVFHRRFTSLVDLTTYQSRSILGFIYLALLPSFAMELLSLPLGVAWYLTLLAVVFAGDSGAYIAGTLLGRRKLMPGISPKKSWEGSMGGLIASFAAGALCATFFGQNPWIVGSLGFCAGFVAQFGDLFESQLKRAAEIKDSGRIMPGHGGVLDRIDGVLFATPVILFGAKLLN